MELDSGWIMFDGYEAETDEIDKSPDKDNMEDDGDEL